MTWDCTSQDFSPSAPQHAIEVLTDIESIADPPPGRRIQRKFDVS
jgi:hypothetical protein